MKKRYGLVVVLGIFINQGISRPIQPISKLQKIKAMETITEQNKAVVRRFNKEVIEEGNSESGKQLMDDQFINHSAPAGSNNGPQGMLNTFTTVLRPAMPDLKVTIYEQVAEGDLVTTRKTISGTQTGPLLGIAPTGRKVSIDVIDIVRVKKGKYLEHWGINTLPVILAQLKAGQ